jgi:opacity protein-like surface antigen
MSLPSSIVKSGVDSSTGRVIRLLPQLSNLRLINYFGMEPARHSFGDPGALTIWGAFLLSGSNTGESLQIEVSRSHTMRRTAILLAGFAIFLTIGATAQESRSEISLQGTGFFTKDTNGQGISRTTTDTGGFQVGYRYNFNRWLAAEADYGYDRNTNKYFGGGFGEASVQANVHAVTGDVVVKLPLRLKGITTYALAGGGGLIFDPTGNFGGSVPGASSQGRGAFLYGAGADYAFTRHFSLRAEYRGFVYKNPDFGLRALNTDSWTHTAQPSAGIVFHF